MTTNTLIKSGQILIAEPFMLDPFFRRSVVLLCEHHEQGSIGLILNKSINMTLNELLPDFPHFEAEVFYGGPVQTDTLSYLHNVGDLLEGSLPVARGVWWGGNFEALRFLTSQGLIQPSNIRFMVGYAGWSAGQLQEEMSYKSWVTGEMDPNYLFNTNPDDLWRLAMYNQGSTYTIIADNADAVSWN
ncbi:MAG: YqgE/AlgH family protein [Saprospiraceae bacterium]|nr:YqgE/AlgH family protein [Saprospiraceae bacterium]MDW8483863.1 YqgE/AlgH family protein [Saprospiraceae bacterium]